MNSITENEHTPLVSIVITTYKRPVEMVLRAIMSVLNQTYHELEVFVVDDSPCTYFERQQVEEKILSINDNRLRYIKNEKNIGACASRNVAIKQATGSLFMYVDDDDELLPECVEKRVEKFASPSVGLVYSDCYYVDDLNGRCYSSNQKKVRGKIFDELIVENFILAFPMLRMESFNKCGLFNEALPASQDYDMWLRVAKEYDVDYVDEPLSRVHLHQNERISTNPERKIKGLELIYQLNEDYINHHKRIKYLKTKEIVPYYLAADEVSKGIHAMFAAFSLAPFSIRENTNMIIHVVWGLLKVLDRRLRGKTHKNETNK